MTPDVNVLLAAFRSDHPQHEVARSWLETAVGEAAAGAAFTLMPMVVASFLRLVTSPKIFKVPSPIDAAIEFVDALTASAGVTMASNGPEWPVMRRLCSEKRLSGNDLPDAWLAAATLHTGEHLASFDRDFRKLLGRGQFTLLAPGRVQR